MRVTYDAENNLAYISLVPHGAVESEEVVDGIVLDFDEAGHLVGIEFLNGRVLHPALLAAAESPKGTGND